MNKNKKRQIINKKDKKDKRYENQKLRIELIKQET